MPSTKVITIKCSRPVYRRAGLRFSKGLNEFPAKDLTGGMLEIIEQDPILEIKDGGELIDLEAKKAAKEATTKGAAKKAAKKDAAKKPAKTATDNASGEAAK